MDSVASTLVRKDTVRSIIDNPLMSILAASLKLLLLVIPFQYLINISSLDSMPMPMRLERLNNSLFQKSTHYAMHRTLKIHGYPPSFLNSKENIASLQVSDLVRFFALERVVVVLLIKSRTSPLPSPRIYESVWSSQGL